MLQESVGTLVINKPVQEFKDRSLEGREAHIVSIWYRSAIITQYMFFFEGVRTGDVMQYYIAWEARCVREKLIR